MIWRMNEDLADAEAYDDIQRAKPLSEFWQWFRVSFICIVKQIRE